MEDILERNRLIAEFMDYRVFEKRYPRNHGIGVPEAEWKDCILEKTKYHSSWDWLVPALKKFKDYLQNIERPSRNHCCKGDMLEVDVQCALWELNIKKTYDAFIPCIKWYNTQNLPK